MSTKNKQKNNKNEEKDTYIRDIIIFSIALIVFVSIPQILFLIFG